VCLNVQFKLHIGAYGEQGLSVVACVSREAFRKMLDEAEKGNDIGIAILSNQGKCIKFTNQKVKVVDYKVISDGALIVQPIDGPYKNQFYWVLEKGTLPVK